MTADDSPADDSGAVGDPRERRSYAKGLARRQEILDRAIAVFAQRGAQRTSLRAIAEDVGVTHAALRHYFSSLEELLIAVYLEAERRNGGVSDAPASETPAQMMRRSAEANHVVPGMVQLYSTLIANALHADHPEAQQFASSRFSRLRQKLADRVRLLQNEGTMRADLDADSVAALVIAASDGLQTQWLLDPTVDQDSALALLDRLLSTESTRAPESPS